MRPLNSMGLGLQAQLRPPKQGGGVTPPVGFIFITDLDGEPMLDTDGEYFMERI